MLLSSATRIPWLFAVLGVLLLAATPLLCDLELCCDEGEDACASSGDNCRCLCTAVAQVEESASADVVFEPISSRPLPVPSLIAQGVCKLPERPPIAAC